MNVLYWDAVGGVSGDMMTAALLDVSDNAEAYLLTELRKLPLKPWQWRREETRRGSFRGLKIDYLVAEEQPHRHLQDIKEIIAQVDYSPTVRGRIIAVFELLAEAESRAHGISKEEVHFHEVGADDTILDIAGVVLLLDYLAIDQVKASPLPLGGGVSQGCHGLMPHPAPALNYLLEGVAIEGVPGKTETVTPTGLALLKAFHAEFGPLPSQTVNKVGCGCGSRDTERPNILRCFLGTAAEPMPSTPTIYRLECTVDDMLGEDIGALWERVWAAGATDMNVTPLQMKKNRPGQKISVMTAKENLTAVSRCLFQHTSTIGMTCQQLDRLVLDRWTETRQTPLGAVTYKKVSGWGITKEKPEFEDLQALAREHGLSIGEVRRLIANATEERE